MATWAARRFPGIAEVCARAGLDFARDLLPVSPAAHYLCGGVDTDLSGRTGIAGLFAAGEVACTRVHGANRLASNSLLEGLVFGARAAAAMAVAPDTPTALPPARWTGPHGRDVRAPRLPRRVDGAAVPALMWRAAGLVRHAEGLDALVRTLGPLADALEAGVEGAHRPTAARGGRPTSRGSPGSSRARLAVAPRAVAGIAAPTSRNETM